jgi:hypothetical protein
VETYGGTRENVPGPSLASRTVNLSPRSFELIFYQKP